MSTRMALLFGSVLLLVGVLLDTYLLLPGEVPVSSLYIVPMFFVGLWCPPKLTGIFAVVVVISFVLTLPSYNPRLYIALPQLLVICLGGLLTYLAALRQAREQAARMAAEHDRLRAEAAERNLRHFVGSVAHDVANPVTSLMAWLSRARRLTDIPDAKEAFDFMESDVQRIRQLSRGVAEEEEPCCKVERVH